MRSKDMKAQLHQYRIIAGLVEKTECSMDENTNFVRLLNENKHLPDGIFQSKIASGEAIDYFYRLSEPKLTADELTEYLLHKQTASLGLIKNCLIYFTAISAIGIFVALIAIIM